MAEICGSCSSLADRGKTVGGAIASARNYLSKGSIDNAKQEYHFALMMLQGGSCRKKCYQVLLAEKEANIDE